MFTEDYYSEQDGVDFNMVRYTQDNWRLLVVFSLYFNSQLIIDREDNVIILCSLFSRVGNKSIIIVMDIVIHILLSV